MVRSFHIPNDRRHHHPFRDFRVRKVHREESTAKLQILQAFPPLRQRRTPGEGQRLNIRSMFFHSDGVGEA